MSKGLPKVMKWVLGVISAIILLEIIYALANPRKTSCEASSLPSLTVEGTTLKAGDQPVCFRGISFGWHNLWPRFYNAGAVQSFSSDWECKLFRASIGADSHALADNPGCHSGYMDESGLALQCLYNVVDAAIESGSYVIVDWHSHVLHLQQAKEFFATVAARYAGVPNVIYELFNEPVSSAFESSGSYDGTCEEEYKVYWQQLKAYASELIQVILKPQGGYEPLILMGCPMWDQRIDLPAADPVQGYDNLMYTVHFYASTHKEYLRERCDAALGAGCPIFISECAACEATGDGDMDMESWKLWSDWASSRGVSMVVWSVSDKDETCSIFTKDASSEGPWGDEVIKPWGGVIREWLRGL